MITGAVSLIMYEMDRGMYLVNRMFSRDVKHTWSWVFFGGTFVAVYYLWLQGIAKFDYESFSKILALVTFVNVAYLMFSNYMTKYPVASIASGLGFFIIFMITLSMSFMMAKLIYVVVMLFFLYYSFFSLMVEQESYDIFALLDLINKTNLQEFDMEDSVTVRFLKSINNYIFTSPVLIVFCFVTMCEMSKVSDMLPDGSWIKMSACVMLVVMFIVAAFYSVFEYYLAFFQRGTNKTDPIDLNNMNGMTRDNVSNDVFETIQRSANDDSDPGQMFKKVMPAIGVFIAVIGILMMVMIVSKSIPKTDNTIEASTT